MKYRKRPVTIEAFQFDGDFKDKNGNVYVPDWAMEAFKNKTLFFVAENLYVKTLEGTMAVQIGNYIIKGIKGELYSCRADIFEKTYELAG